MITQEFLRSLSPQFGKLLGEKRRNGECVQVRQHGVFRWLSFGDKPLQSLMDIEHPHRIILPYIEAMIGVFLFPPRVDKALNLGFGGGGVERYLQAVKPDVSLISVESSAEVVELAKEFFCIEKERRIEVNSAATFLDQCQNQFAVVLCDIFANRGHPDCMQDPIFYERIHQILDDDGALAINCLCEGEEELLGILLSLRLFFSYVFVLDLPGVLNVLLFAVKGMPASMAQLERRAEQFLRESGTDLRWLPRQITLLPPSNAE